ncbi:hypothetical protein Dip518_000585 [Parelusimicrobium proximum]|uniref:PilW family protein n=1 Tax=Parelusimicrobium proximum TaxID=3228953 RepID=UPI003D171763
MKNIFNNKGFTFSEVLVASFITMLIMLALIGLWISSASFATNSRSETMIKNNISIASGMIQRDISKATAVGLKTWSISVPEVEKPQPVLYLGHNVLPKNNVEKPMPGQSSYAAVYCYDNTKKTFSRKLKTLNYPTYLWSSVLAESNDTACAGAEILLTGVTAVNMFRKSNVLRIELNLEYTVSSGDEGSRVLDLSWGRDFVTSATNE